MPFLTDADLGIGGGSALLSDADLGLGVPAQQVPQKFGLTDTWPFRVARSILEEAQNVKGLFSGEIPVRQGGEITPEAIRGMAQTALAAGPISPAARVGVGWAGVPKTPVEGSAFVAAPSVPQLKASYEAAKNAPEVESVVLKPEAAGQIADVLAAELQKRKFGSQAQGTYGIIDELKASVPQAPTPQFQMQGLEAAGYTTPQASPRFTTMANLDDFRRRLGEIAGGSNMTDAAAAQIAKKRLDELIPKIGSGDVLAGDPALAQRIMAGGRQDYTAAKLGEAFDTRLARTELRNAATNSGMNMQNKLRQNVASFLSSSDANALNATERAALEGFVRGTGSQNLMRDIGNTFGGGGGIGTWIPGASIGGVVTAVTGNPMLGTAAATTTMMAGRGVKILSNALTSRDANRLSEVLRSRSPLGQQMRNSVEAWQKYAEATQTKPYTPRMMSMLLIQSRNLANNLKDAGISVSPGDLMRGVQGPMGSGNSQEQP